MTDQIDAVPTASMGVGGQCEKEVTWQGQVQQALGLCMACCGRLVGVVAIGAGK